MKRIFLISLVILYFANSVAAMEKEPHELIDIADLMLENNLTIDNWQVTLKEHMSKNEINALLKELANSYTVTEEENENSYIFIVKDTQKKGTLIVSYNAIVPKDEQYSPELVVTLRGYTWNGKMKSSFLEKFSLVHRKYFTKDAKIFSCMSSRANAIMDSNYIVQNFTEKLNLLHKKTVNDNVNSKRNLEITYGYTSLWGQKITIQDTPVNVQIVTENVAGGGVQYLIGTPILINEY